MAGSGTAAPRLGGLSGVGAKTGTAEEGDHTNGWLTAYNSRIAVAALDQPAARPLIRLFGRTRTALSVLRRASDPAQDAVVASK
ncbi:hypothetical protein [Streptomyces griseus]|uniref:hypothetical protein n=1 Tax=Streptomyces griseus TaxID=1911 RepID=UPI00055A4810|nr:hypothetical protein [Streptomyces griseus]